uniref:APC membrane recruitment protein 2 n=1 Tax=Denticeps clupeoides TaxID=299321 RepID=A0AAY3ZX06_9TELE
MDVQSESCEPPPSDPQAPGKIRKAFKLFGKGKPGSSVASIFSRRSKGEGAPKSTFSRSKTLEGLSESMAAPQDAQEAQVSPARPSISSITSAKSLNFLSLLRKTRRGTGGGDRQVHTESQRGGRQRKGLKGLFGSIRWRRRDEEHDEDGPPPLTASRSNSVEIIKEDLTLTPRPPQRADAERDQECQQETPNVGGANEAKAATMATSQLTASSADPPSDRLSTLLADISSILSFDSLTGCGDIVADVEAEWVKASNRVGAAAAAAASAGGDESNSGDKTSPPCSKPPFTTPAAAPPPSAKHPPASTSTQPPPSTCPVPSPVPVEKEAQEDGGEDLASREGIDEKDMGGQWSKPQLKDEPQSAVIDQDSQGEKKSPVVKPTALSKIPICGGARPGKQARESQPNGEEVPWSLPTPGPEEDGMRPLSQDASSKDPFGECVPQPTATTPTTSQEENKFSPPAQTSSRLPSKGTTAGPRDSKIPIKQGAHSAPIYHSIQGKADATRTKIPVSKVPVRRSVSKPVEAVTTASARK